MDISSHVHLGVSERSSEQNTSTGMRALAIKQSWQQAYDVLDMNFSHNALMHTEVEQPDGSNNSFLDGVNIVDSEGVSEKVFIANDSRVNKNHISYESRWGDQILSYGINTSGNLNGLAGTIRHDNNVEALPLKEITQNSLLNNVTRINDVFHVKRAIVSGASGSIDQVLLKVDSTGVPGAISKNQAVMDNLLNARDDGTAPVKISLTRVGDNYLIMARDYRVEEKYTTRKIINSLKSMILAGGGTIKKILMNGKSVF